MSWKNSNFSDVVNDITGGNVKFQSSEYLSAGKYPIIDQGEKEIGGYTNQEDIVNRKKDVVVFGDHTKCLKFIDYDFCLGADGVKVLEPINELDTKFLYFYLSTITLPNVGYSRHFKFLKEIQIPLPPLPIQKRIAEILDAADALRRKDQELLRKYDELAQAIFIDMFGDPVKNEKGWEVKRLGDLFSCPVKCGPFGSALKKEEYIRGGVPVWVMDNIQNYDFNENGCLFITEEKYDELKSYSAKNGDIIISRAGTVGKMSVINSKYIKSIISTNLIKISLDESRISPYYFIKLMEYFGKKIGRLRTGSENGFTHMNTGVLAGLTFPLPPIEYQLRFIEVLSNLKNQSKVLSTQPDQLFNSLLQQAFKGELVK